MGWSCRTEASTVLNMWQSMCREQTGSTNVFKGKDRNYFFEVSNKEHTDGAITGVIMKMFKTPDGRNMCRKSGSFRIEPDGTVKRGPKILKDAAEKAKPRIKERLSMAIGSGGM